MKIASNIASIPELKKPIALSIGTFDGVHLGHQHLLKTLKSYGTSVVFTFTNHPLEVIQPNTKVPSLTPYAYKLKLLEKTNIAICTIQEFSNDMANMTYNVFLEEIYHSIPFDHICFGGDDAIGKNREGTREKISELGSVLGFTPHYLPKITIDNEIVSSTTIRNYLRKGNLKMAEKLLGRPFATYTKLATPFVDPSLLKTGSYQLQIQSDSDSFQTKGKVASNGSILFDTPSYLKLEEYATITFFKD